MNKRTTTKTGQSRGKVVLKRYKREMKEWKRRKRRKYTKEESKWKMKKGGRKEVDMNGRKEIN